MTTIDPWTISADGLSFGTFAHSIEVVRGIESVPARRGRSQEAYARHGDIAAFDSYYAAKTVTLLVKIGPWDDDGVSNQHAAGNFGQLRENWEQMAVVLGKRHDFIDLQRIVPADSGDSGETVTLQADAVVHRSVEVTGSPVLWQALVEFILPYPMWHENPQVQRSAATSHQIMVGGTAPVADMVFVFSGDGTVTWTETGYAIGVSGSTGAVTVDVGKRKATQGGNVDMSVLRLADAPDNWMEWPAQTEVNLSSTVNVAVNYYNARH